MLVIRHAMYVNKKKLLAELRSEYASFNGAQVARSAKQSPYNTDLSCGPTPQDRERDIANDFYMRGWGRALIAVARALGISKEELQKEIERGET